MSGAGVAIVSEPVNVFQASLTQQMRADGVATGWWARNDAQSRRVDARSRSAFFPGAAVSVSPGSWAGLRMAGDRARLCSCSKEERCCQQARLLPLAALELLAALPAHTESPEELYERTCCDSISRASPSASLTKR